MSERGGIESVRKTLRLLDLMSRHNGEWTVTEIAERLDCSVSSANRFLQTLMQEGFAEKNSRTSRYELSPQICRLSANLVGSDATLQRLIPLAHVVSQTYDVSVNINVLHGKDAMMLFRVTRHNNKDLDLISGHSVPAYCSSAGKMILAQLSAEQLGDYFDGLQMRSFQKERITQETLRAEIETARQRGYAVCQEEYVSGVFSFSLPVRDHRGHVYAFTVITSMAEKKRVFRAEVLREIRKQLDEL